MKYWDFNEFFRFGTCLQHLLDVDEGNEVRGVGSIRHDISLFFEFLDTLGLEITKQVAMGELLDVFNTLSKYQGEGVLSADDARRIREALAAIQPTLDAELSSMGAYVPTPNQIDLHKLLDDVPKLFAPDVFDHLPSMNQNDFT